MKRVENQCVGCPPEMGCLGTACINRNVVIFTCDRCNNDEETLYEWDGQEVCLDCIMDEIENDLVEIK